MSCPGRLGLAFLAFAISLVLLISISFLSRESRLPPEEGQIIRAIVLHEWDNPLYRSQLTTLLKRGSPAYDDGILPKDKVAQGISTENTIDIEDVKFLDRETALMTVMISVRYSKQCNLMRLQYQVVKNNGTWKVVQVTTKAET